MDLGIFCVLPPQSGKAAEKTPTKACDAEVYEKKIKLLEKQRKDVSFLSFYLSFCLSFCLSWLLLILFCHGGKSLCICFLYVQCCLFHFLVLLTGSGGEQAVGHSVELHEVTV